MFLKNTTDSVIKLRSFEGYRFELPTGVSWIWDKAGEHLLKVYEPQGENGNFKLNSEGKKVFVQKNVVPPVVISTKALWKKERKLAKVERFKVDYKLLTRKKLIPLAKIRGVDNDKITEWLADDTIDQSVIAEVINALPIPEEVRFPQELGEDDTEEAKSKDETQE